MEEIATSQPRVRQQWVPRADCASKSPIDGNSFTEPVLFPAQEKADHATDNGGPQKHLERTFSHGIRKRLSEVGNLIASGFKNVLRAIAHVLEFVGRRIQGFAPHFLNRVESVFTLGSNLLTCRGHDSLFLAE